MSDEAYVRLALREAEKAEADGEIPVGAILVRGGEILCATHNRCEETRDPTAHAEMLALREGCGKSNSRWLSDCTLYVTMEPCPMCAGAIVGARVGRVVYGTPDARMGAFGSLLDLRQYPLESRPAVQSGVLEEECKLPLRRFFSERRKK